MSALHPISIAKYLTLKHNLWRSMQRWAYLWHLYSWLRFTIFSKGRVSSSIEIHFLILLITTRFGLSLVTSRSGGIVHGFRSTLIIRSLSLTWFTNSVIFLSVLSWPHVYLPWSNINLQPESTWAMVSQSPQRSHDGRGGGTHILGHGREVPRWWPPFLRFSIRLGLYFIPHHNPIDPLFLQKNRFVSITFSSRDTRT